MTGSDILQIHILFVPSWEKIDKITTVRSRQILNYQMLHKFFDIFFVETLALQETLRLLRKDECWFCKLSKPWHIVVGWSCKYARYNLTAFNIYGSLSLDRIYRPLSNDEIFVNLTLDNVRGSWKSFWVCVLLLIKFILEFESSKFVLAIACFTLLNIVEKKDYTKQNHSRSYMAVWSEPELARSCLWN